MIERRNCVVFLVCIKTLCLGNIMKYLTSCHGRWTAPGCFVVFWVFCCPFVVCLFVCFFFLRFSVSVWWWCGVVRGGMLTFMFMLRWWCYVDHGVGRGGMLTFMFMLRWWCYVDHGVLWGGMLTFMFMLRLWCYVDHWLGWGGMLTFKFMLRWWCYIDHGVSWGGMLTFMVMLRWWCYVDHGVLWGGMLTFMFILCWNCSMVELVFEKWKNWRARSHAQLHWEVHANHFKTTRRRSAPFPN